MQIDIILEPDLTPDQLKELGLLAERYGIGTVWAQNYAYARDAFMSLVPLACASDHIRVGVVVVSAYESHPLKMANALLTLNEYARGRASMVLGAGGEWPGVMGVGYGKRITIAREALELVKGSFAGHVLNYEGEVYKARRFNAAWATDRPPRVYGGASGEKMLGMSAGIADGVMLSDMALPMIDKRIEILREALESAGRATDEFHLSNFWAWHVKEDREAAVVEARRELIIRGWLGREWLEPFLSAEGCEIVMANKGAFLKAYREKTGEIEGVPPHIVNTLIEGLTCTGGVGEIDKHIDRIQQFAARGLTELALRVHDRPADAIRLIGERVLPALQ